METHLDSRLELTRHRLDGGTRHERHGPPHDTIDRAATTQVQHRPPNSAPFVVSLDGQEELRSRRRDTRGGGEQIYLNSWRS